MDDSNNLSPYEELGPIRPSTCFDKPKPSSPPAAIKTLIAQLGLRYRPSAQADLEAHAGLLALLARDVADLDPRDLDEAIQKHVRRSPFMPKACELIELADTARANREYRSALRPFALIAQHEEEKEELVPCTPEQAEEILREFGLKANPLGEG